MDDCFLILCSIYSRGHSNYSLLSDVLTLIFLPLSGVNFHLLAGIQKQWTWVKTSRKRFLPKCMIADAGAMPRQNPAHVTLSLPVGREWLDELGAAFTLPLMPQDTSLEGSSHSWEKARFRSGAREQQLVLFTVVISLQNKVMTKFPPCCGFLLQLKLPGRYQPGQGVWGGNKHHLESVCRSDAQKSI